MKKVVILATVLATASLTGCSSVKNYYSEQIREKSGILEENSYQKYEEYADSGHLDADGYYTEDVQAPENHAQVHVTFALNDNLDIQYFTDAEQKNAVDTASCYLNPGDTLYAVVKADDAYSSMYKPGGFRVYEYDQDSSRQLSAALKFIGAGEEYALSVPEDYDGTEISVEPIGSYSKRQISLNDYLIDDDGNREALAGTWTVNNETCVGSSINISAFNSYTVSYEYDSDEYFYLSSTPESYYINYEEGIIIFKEREAGDETADYSVELHSYLSYSIVSGETRSVTVNGGEKQTVRANEELELSKLKYGDTITLITDKAWADLATNEDLILTESGRAAGQYKYVLTVPEKDGQFTFNPDDYNYEHGTITFRSASGNEITSTKVMARQSKIYYEGTGDEGYWLAGNNHYIEVGDEETTRAALEAIHFTKKVDVTVQLKQPEAGGSIVYSDPISKKTYGKDESVSTYSGTSIAMELEPWEGWKINPKITKLQGDDDKFTYKIGDTKTQTPSINGVKVDQLFVEDEEHKPTLSVTLEKKVDTKAKFGISASGGSWDASFVDGSMLGDAIARNGRQHSFTGDTQTIISNEIIGTDKPITISISDKAIQHGTAVRIAITKTHDKETEKEIRYIDDSSKKIDPIYIYEPGTEADSPIWYDSIDIRIGIVDVVNFESVKPTANTKITVTNSTTGKALYNSTELIEKSQKVIVKISSSSGYYLTGKNVSKDTYSKEMKYSDYLNDIQDIVSSHTAKKYITLTLDASDGFADYQYRLAGEKVSGTVNAKEDQKLELTYKITDSAYKLSEKSGGVFGFGASDTEVTASITVKADMDGKTITKKDFNIETRKGN